jgi:alginate O-acetyltransferase complex protein AlgJ
MGVKYLHFFAPDKLAIYPEMVGEPLPAYDRRPGHCIPASMGFPSFIANVEDAMFKDKDASRLYFKTDSHWTFWGAHRAYLSLCASLGIQPLADLTIRPYSEKSLAFDLGGKFNPKIKESGRFYNVEKYAKRTFANCLVQEIESGVAQVGDLHALTSVAFSNDSPAAIDASVIIFGDSFCEYRPYLLTGMLAETFKKVRFCWSASIDFKMIDRDKPDIVISEVAERFVKRIPDDSRDLEALAESRLIQCRTQQTP